MNKYVIKDKCRNNLLEYTRKSFDIIPRIDKPLILDLGCGTGVSTIEIEKITKGRIIAIDSDKECVDYFKQKISYLKNYSNISIIHDSVFDVNLTKYKFDIIVAEGLFNIIGFKRGLSYFSKYLKKNGYFIIHDEYNTNDKKLYFIEQYGFEMLESFILNEKVWWRDYFSCLEKNIEEFEKKEKNDIDLKDFFIQEKSEINMFKKNPKRFQSIFYILKRN